MCAMLPYLPPPPAPPPDGFPVNPEAVSKSDCPVALLATVSMVMNDRARAAFARAALPAERDGPCRLDVLRVLTDWLHKER